MENEFINWENLDLDELLGDYTDDEAIGAESEWASSSSSSNAGSDKDELVVAANTPTESPNSILVAPEVDKENVAPTTKKTYECPLCNKNYKSASGFRGHVGKKHQRPDLKAHQHMTSDASRVDLPKKEVPLATKENLEKDMPKIINEAVNSICNDPFLNLAACHHGATILKIASQLLVANITMLSFIAMTYIGPIFLSDSSPSVVLPKLHHLRFNPIFIDEMLDFVMMNINFQVEVRMAKLFIQQLITTTTTSFYAVRVQRVNLEMETNIKAVSDSDKEVLYYICGFIIHSLKKRYIRAKKNSAQFLELIDELRQQDNDNNSASQWTKILDRGGLQKPSAKLFYLTVQIEKWLQEVVNVNNLNTNTLVKLKAKLLDYKLLKASWGNIIQADDESKWTILEHYLGVFLKVRGFAVTRLLRKQAQKKRKSTNGVAGTRKALRKELKQMSV